jgi:lipopolysaccharide/colanic/teichoic acid biosynthesis glycosyltransferase
MQPTTTLIWSSVYKITQQVLQEVERLAVNLESTYGTFRETLRTDLPIMENIWQLPTTALRVALAPRYHQEREGFDGRRLRVWKLRTMHLEADRLLEEWLAAHPEDRIKWSRYFKLPRDPRILPFIGRILRRTSLDELPQLWSVLKGEMSLVGPRPFPDYHLEHFSQDFRALRTRVLPGLTGLWQVSARGDGDVEVQETLDTYYIRNWSPWLDLYILARTVAAVILARGAY